MESKPDPRGRVTLALMVLTLLWGIQWLPSHLQSWQAHSPVWPGCVCSKATAANAAPAPQAQASSCDDPTCERAASLRLLVRTLPWRPWLRPAEARRGVTYSGSGAGLRRLAAKLLAGQPISIVAIGGSVTFAGGPKPSGQSYVAHFFNYIKSTFPHRQHKMHNSGVPAWSSANFEPCLDSFVPQDADLVVMEFAINDHAADRCPYEQLLRRLLQLPTQPAVLILQLYPWWRSARDGIPEGLYSREPEIGQTVLAQYYDVPVVSLRAAAWRLMHAGIEGFQVDKVTLKPNQTSMGNESHIVPVADEAEKDSYFYRDTVHPDLSKLEVLAELLIQPLATAVEEVALGADFDDRQDVRLQGLPPPLTPGLHDRAASSCYMMEEFKPLVKEARGFNYQPEHPKAPTFLQQKWGWSGSQPGNWVEFEVDTQRPGANSTKQSVEVGLVHLTSYRDVGRANVTCTSGCICQPTQLDAREDISSTVLRMRWLTVTPHSRCVLRAEITSEQTADGRHKFMFAALVVRAAE